MSEKLQAIYAELPKIDCQRKCQAYCGPLLIGRSEYVTIEKTGAVFELSSIAAVILSKRWEHLDKSKLVATRPDNDMRCIMLYPNGKCRIYGIRPLVCRLWGLIDEPLMRCPYGCVPERWLTDKEARSITDRVLLIQETL